MTVQFNLLPAVKLEFIKARRMKRLVTLSSVLVSVVSLFVLLLFLISVDVVQKKSLSDLKTDIDTNTTQLKNIKDLDKILTVQNQLNTLNDLHSKKVVASRLFTYLPQFTPQGINLSSMSVDFDQNTFTISGSAPDLQSISGYISSLKATTYQTDETGSTPTKVFSNVTLSSFARGGGGSASTYSTTFGFNPIIFDGSKTAKLSVPKSTISNTSLLFQDTK